MSLNDAVFDIKKINDVIDYGNVAIKFRKVIHV